MFLYFLLSPLPTEDASLKNLQKYFIFFVNPFVYKGIVYEPQLERNWTRILVFVLGYRGNNWAFGVRSLKDYKKNTNKLRSREISIIPFLMKGKPNQWISAWIFIVSSSLLCNLSKSNNIGKLSAFAESFFGEILTS